MPSKKEVLISGLKSAAISAIALLLTEGATVLTSMDYIVTIGGTPVDLTAFVFAAVAVVVSVIRKLVGL